MGNMNIQKRLLNKLPTRFTLPILDLYLLHFLEKNNLSIIKSQLYFDIIDSQSRCIRISRKHNIYIRDIVSQFEYYWKAVNPVQLGKMRLVDYSVPRFHEVMGFDLHPIYFPSLAEPLITTEQYLDFADLRNGSVVLDLGAYNGFTSIVFDQNVGNYGHVIAVDADEVNIQAIEKNLSLYSKVTGRRIEVLEGAVWDNDDGIMFSSEGSPGSSASGIIGDYRGEQRKVRSFTLSTIARKYGLPQVDFIKCDIEGAEINVFNDAEFFERYRPKIIIESHMVQNQSTSMACMDILFNYGYKCKEIPQIGVSLPLIECEPV